MYDLNPLDESVGKAVISLNCHLITLMDVIPGKIELTSTHICFYDDSNESLAGSGCDFQFPLEKLQEIHMRRYTLRKTGLEFFLVDRSSYFINFRDFKVPNAGFTLLILVYKFGKSSVKRRMSSSDSHVDELEHVLLLVYF